MFASKIALLITAVATFQAGLSNAAPISSGNFKGEGTFYAPGLGACEVTSGPNELIAALNAPQYGNAPRGSDSCFKCASVTGPKGSVKVKIVDKCPGCKHGDLDLSPAAFNKIANEADGRVSISWTYTSC
ncbi:barwin-like endoglucanase [Basidiobolus meristosporus CBS 931.73]|uniref:Barwin-like endoglucanase n=1 Tax=Basidiobolus meristosporus CBS 931.73 TaxID=1314790 RepID=A0A1Y1YGW1_9FUNG|nr:barwin-like endoglucanase [Basidiobolus meristosporus CBS 931.73]|eukprot:ORX97261.1 barwin-like endoglucanase [Basidiobolus meristosporus CBS 931.73]